jgi:hypothetical protein
LFLSFYDSEKIQITDDCRRFNAYLQGAPGRETWMPGDFLVHFAGVYDPFNIYRMMKYVESQYKKNAPLDTKLLDTWRQTPIASLAAAESSLSGIV